MYVLIEGLSHCQPRRITSEFFTSSDISKYVLTHLNIKNLVHLSSQGLEKPLVSHKLNKYCKSMAIQLQQ